MDDNYIKSGKFGNRNGELKNQIQK